MKKKYFAEYIPVEGEIKKGDKVTNYTQDVYSDSQAGFMNAEGSFKKLKLMLCSRDIQVGDKVRHISGAEVEAYKINPRGEGNRTELLVKDGIHIIPMWLDEFFKVIGEISPDALFFIKEGDEIEKYDTEMFFLYKNKWYKERQYDMELQETKYFKTIKGPDGNFH